MEKSSEVIQCIGKIDRDEFHQAGLDLFAHAEKMCSRKKFKRAAEMFFISRSWFECSKAYERAASLSIPFDERAHLYCLAGIILSRLSVMDANELYRKAITNFCESRTFFLAGKVQILLAEYLTLQHQALECQQAYVKAAKLFAADCSIRNQNNTRQISSCMLIAVRIAGQQQSYSTKECKELICQSLEEHFFESYDNVLSYFNIPDHLLCYGLVYIYVHCYQENSNEVSLEHTLDIFESWKNRSSIYASSKESKFLDELAKLLFGGHTDFDNFIDQIYFFDCAKNLDVWSLNVLLSIIESKFPGHMREV